MTPDEVRDLPVVVDLPTANRVLGIGDSLGYQLAKRGEYPCPVLRLGRLYRVPRTGLLQVLGLSEGEGDAPAAESRTR